MPEISIIPRELKKLTFAPSTWDLHLSKFWYETFKSHVLKKLSDCVPPILSLFKPQMIWMYLVPLLCITELIWMKMLLNSDAVEDKRAINLFSIDIF